MSYQRSFLGQTSAALDTRTPVRLAQNWLLGSSSTTARDQQAAAVLVGGGLVLGAVAMHLMHRYHVMGMT